MTEFSDRQLLKFVVKAWILEKLLIYKLDEERTAAEVAASLGATAMLSNISNEDIEPALHEVLQEVVNEIAAEGRGDAEPAFRNTEATSTARHENWD